MASGSHLAAWGGLLGSIRTGENAFKTIHGESAWDYRATRPEDNAMFDAGFQLGHSLRTAADAVQLARTDGVICSSLIDCRLIGGAQPLLEDFRAQFERMVRKRSKAVCKLFYAARADERQHYGESLYLLEPHVKRSRGGLRDIHLLRWVGFAEHAESDPDRLALKGTMS